MKKLLIIAILLFSSTAHSKTAFCAGFEDGYKSVKGSYAFAPFCPFPPFGYKTYLSGFKVGVLKASR